MLGLPVVDATGTAPQHMVWTVSALVHAVADALAGRFAACTVSGELASFSRAPSGHCYFTLKDAAGAPAQIRCAMFRRAAAMLSFVPGDGQVVQVRGRLAVYEPRGELQFVVEAMLPAGAGALYEQFLRLKARLEAEGLFDPQRKRPLPGFVRRVGVVTSLSAAALHDVLSSFARRAPHVAVIVYPSLVQGADAPAALVDAMACAAERHEVDVLIVCRGGGSAEDLWAFNHEAVVRAVAASPVPVVSGVGHETDVTLTDFAADLRAPTPTAAAELVTPATQDCEARIAALARWLQARMHRRLDLQAQRLDAAAARLARPGDALRRQRAIVEAIGQRFATLAQRQLSARGVALERALHRWQRAGSAAQVQRRQQIERLAARLSALDPTAVLRRGYAWLADDAGRPVPSVQQLVVGQAVTAVLADGAAELEVQRIVPREAG